MSQPNWQLIANLGDANPIDYGGYFIYQDTTGVYVEEGEKLIVPEDFERQRELGEYTIYRFSLDRLKQVQIGEEIFLVPFKYNETWSYPNPASEYDEWFHHNRFERVAEAVGQTVQELRDAFCSEDPRVRAFAYEALGDYHGWENLDSYPLTFTSREEVEKRYKS